MTYRVKKSIQQYSLVDLLEIMRNERHEEYLLVEQEFQRRQPSKKELELAKAGLEIRIKSRNKPLSVGDKIYCFLIPFIATRDPWVNNSSEIKDEFEKQIDEFEMYGETRRVEELKKWQAYARITYIILFGLFVITALLIMIVRQLKVV